MSSMFDLDSLQGKITSTYVVLVTGIILLGAIALLDLLFLKQQVAQGEVVTRLKNTVQEMRREEKNSFLYHDQQTLLRTQSHADLARQILLDNKTLMSGISTERDINKLENYFSQYLQLLKDKTENTPLQNNILQNKIREIGHQIYFSVNKLSEQERRSLKDAILESQWLLLISLLLIGIAIFTLGRKLKNVVVNPIMQLESHLELIAQGRFSNLEVPSSDREYRTFTKAFNKMLKELEVRQKRMLQSEKLASLGILSAGVAHELNNPLSNISSSCQLLTEELEDGNTKQLKIWLKQIDNETERGRKIVRTLLDYGSQHNFHTKDLKLLDVINETQTFIAKSLYQSVASFSLNIPETLYIHADKQRVQQLFINIIQNALQAGDKNVHIKISAIMCKRKISMLPEGAKVAGDLNCINHHDGRFVEILVDDDGSGIPGEKLSKVFDPFFTTSKTGHGVGLGLYIVQEIVAEHDGCMGIISKQGKGTRVIILLPGKETQHD